MGRSFDCGCLLPCGVVLVGIGQVVAADQPGRDHAVNQHVSFGNHRLVELDPRRQPSNLGIGRVAFYNHRFGAGPGTDGIVLDRGRDAQ